MRQHKLISGWARTALLSLLLLLILHIVTVALFYAGESGAAMSPVVGGIAAALVFAFVAVVNSQTMGPVAPRASISPWSQLAVGMVMTFAQGILLAALYFVTRAVLATVTLSGGLFIVVFAIGIAYVPLIAFLTWQLRCSWARRNARTVAAPEDDKSKERDVQRPSQLIGAPFWLWLATFGAAIGLAFGLDQRLAPYPVIGMSAGVYLTTFYVVLFGLIVYQVFALYMRNRARADS